MTLQSACSNWKSAASLPLRRRRAAGAYECTFAAGAVADGSVLNLNAQATDVHGNPSGWRALPVLVDATPPQLTLSLKPWRPWATAGSMPRNWR